MYDKLKFKCPYDDECRFIGQTSQALDHLKDCKMFKEMCPNQCGKKVAKKNLDFHKKYRCLETEVICDLCGIPEFPLKDNFYHSCLESLKAKVHSS